MVEQVDFYGLSPETFLKYLPMKNCEGCGYKTCKEMAVALSSGQAQIKECPEMAMRMAQSLEGALSIKLEVHEADASMSTVTEKLIEINNPGPDSPVLITGNSGVTLMVLKMIFEKTPGVAAYIIPTETKGYTVDHAAGLRLMSPMTVMRGLTNSAINGKVSHRRLIIPGLCAGIEKQVESMTRWSIEVGPNSGFELPAYITSKSTE